MSSPPGSTRREFLTGQAAADAAADLANRAVAIEGAGEPAEHVGLTARRSPPAGTPYQIRVGRRAMACLFEVLLNAGQYPQAAAAALAALDQVELLEEQLTVYRDTSEIMEINRLAAAGPVVVERRLFELLQLAVELHRQTKGAYDITSGPLTKIWGFYRRQGAIPTPEQLETARRVVGSHLLHLDDTEQTVRFLQLGVELNLGSIGKGYALDRSAEVLEDAGVRDFLLHGGHSSLLARGSRNGSMGWPVGLADPLRPGKQLLTIYLRDRALGTSGAAFQFFRQQGKRFGHILDPRTGQPAEGVLSANVLAPNATEADALSTAFYVLGPERAREICRLRPEIGMLMVCGSPGSSEIACHRANLDDALLEPAASLPWAQP